MSSRWDRAVQPQSLRILNAERLARRAAALITDLSDGTDRVVREGELLPGALGEAARRAFRSGNSGVIEADGRSFFLNVNLPPPRLVVIGAVHISQALAPMARLAGYDLEIIDPRTAFATPDRFPEVSLFADWPETVLSQRPLDPYSALAAVTHDPKIDDPALVAALRAGCFYVGALGSRKTHARRLERLAGLGVSHEQLARIQAPIGLDIGAANPSEIAVAVLAQIIQTFRQRGAARTREADAKGEAA
jgi:xanthine dehydrogenase accessory factor